MTLLRPAVLAAVWVAAQAVCATSLGHEQREAFAFWQRQQRHRALVSRQVTSDPTCVGATPADGLTERFDLRNNQFFLSKLMIFCDRLNSLLQNGGDNYILSLCPNTTYPLTGPLVFTNPGQEISTAGYPIDDSRAILLVNGSTANDGTGHTIAIQGGCPQCKDIKMRNFQIDGNRRGAPPISGGGNMEIGGSGGGQLVEFVKSFDPRGWSCLHIAEGVLDCANATVRYNDIGPCGSDVFGHWSDGISLSCKDSQVYDNWIKDPTDGGIVIFQSPGSLIRNNTIWVENNTCLGGINLVDYDPFAGNYTGTQHQSPIRVQQRECYYKDGDTSRVETLFGYGIPVSGVKDFTVRDNIMFGNYTFIGAKGPNCTEKDIVPPAVDFVIDPAAVTTSSILGVWKLHTITALLCLTPPRGGTSPVWPLGTWPDASPPANVSGGSTLKSASDWCSAGESNDACMTRFATSLYGKPVSFITGREL
ncbi:right-handed beta helix region protein [Ceratobasidium sp. AG-Ba]|nr:right-handed beta helix region protein [Ceratobasidium sp. AG-Ba]QRW01618.1 right-handed beta helix region protein [Ceratobasidium sp. AG-Ba]